MKTLDNTTENQAKDQAKDQVSDLKLWGAPDMWKLISKASSIKVGWMKSTKAMEIPGVGCVIQVTTQQLNNSGTIKQSYDSEGIYQNPDYKGDWEIKSSVIAEAVTFVPGVMIEETKEDGKIMSRIIVKLT